MAFRSGHDGLNDWKHEGKPSLIKNTWLTQQAYQLLYGKSNFIFRWKFIKIRLTILWVEEEE